MNSHESAGRPAKRVRRVVWLCAPTNAAPWNPFLQPIEPSLAEHGIELKRIDWPANSLLQAAAQLRRVRREIQSFEADILHLFGDLPLLLAGLTTLGHPKPILILSAENRLGPAWLRRRASQRAQKVVAWLPTESISWRVNAIPQEKIELLPAAIPPSPTTNLNRQQLLTQLGLPPQSKLIVTAGPLDEKDPMRLAIWTFDILRHTDPDLHLVIIGEGAARPWLQQFIQSLAWDDCRVHLTGSAFEFAMMCQHAEVVWHLAETGGLVAALNATAIGCPVIGVQQPDLESILNDCSPSLLVSAPDPVKLAQTTHELLASACRTPRPEEAWFERFSWQRLAERLVTVYDEG